MVYIYICIHTHVIHIMCISIYIYTYCYVYEKNHKMFSCSLPATNPLDLLANDSSARPIRICRNTPAASTGKKLSLRLYIIQPYSTPLYILYNNIYIYTTILLPHILLLYVPIRKVKHHLKQTHMLYYSLINYRCIYHKP